MSTLRIILFFSLTLISQISLAQNQSPAKLQFEPNTINFGKIPYKSKTEATVKYWNNSQQPIIIKNISTECNCTKVKWSKAPLMPGDTLSMTVSYSADSPGQFYKAIKVLSTDQPKEHRIIVRGDVIQN